MNDINQSDQSINQTLDTIHRDEEEGHAQATAGALGLNYVNLNNYPIESEVATLIPKENVHRLGIVAYDRQGDVVHVATNAPQNAEIAQYLAELSAASRFQFVLSYVSKSSIKEALALYEQLTPEKLKTDAVEVTEEMKQKFDQEIQTLKDLGDKIGKISTTEILDFLFAGALKTDATDIHLEPQETYFRVRFRIDGVLQDVVQLPIASYKQVSSRVKMLAHLKLDVTHPQDGRFEVQVAASQVDIRVSSLPTAYGEAIVMRLLPKDKKFVSLESLGFNEQALAKVREAISKPQGLILVTGPTGSGKTTTLYAILQKLNEPGKKIITFENPIEYRIEGIEQTQIDEENETGFLEALRASLRQDPDIMMVGEIRDAETAKIALQAAMTGHLVLSTVHTNNAPSTLARLAEMGVEPYLLAGSINLILGQRLVRAIHKDCGGKGCPVDHQTGYKGRMAIVEALVPGKEIEELILKQAPLREFEETAHKLGMQTMYEDGMAKVASGLTTKEEVERVTKE